MFETFTDKNVLPPRLHGAVIAIGNFDGVHRGHQAVIAEALKLARSENRPALALTFEPHPRSFFVPDKPVFRLTSPQEKRVLFEAMGLQGEIVKTFDALLASQSAEEFIMFLRKECHAMFVVAGHDFHFGTGRAGTPDVLKDLAARQGMGVMLVPPQEMNGTPISSSAIRAALEVGDVATANTLLGYRWFVEAQVQHGDKRGHALGFPTANIALPKDCNLKHGVYAARAFAQGAWFGAAVHFGGRIQFGASAPVLEAHLLDFNGDLYGQELRIEFIDFIRAEEKFADVEALVRQMGRDVDAVRQRVAEAVTQPVTNLQKGLEEKAGFPLSRE